VDSGGARRQGVPVWHAAQGNMHGQRTRDICEEKAGRSRRAFAINRKYSERRVQSVVDSVHRDTKNTDMTRDGLGRRGHPCPTACRPDKRMGETGTDEDGRRAADVRSGWFRPERTPFCLSLSVLWSRMDLVPLRKERNETWRSGKARPGTGRPGHGEPGVTARQYDVLSSLAVILRLVTLPAWTRARVELSLIMACQFSGSLRG
jgi:hypothetical protein